MSASFPAKLIALPCMGGLDSALVVMVILTTELIRMLCPYSQTLSKPGTKFDINLNSELIWAKFKNWLIW